MQQVLKKNNSLNQSHSEEIQSPLFVFKDKKDSFIFFNLCQNRMFAQHKILLQPCASLISYAAPSHAHFILRALMKPLCTYLLPSDKLWTMCSLHCPQSFVHMLRSPRRRLPNVPHLSKLISQNLSIAPVPFPTPGLSFISQIRAPFM